MRPLYARRVFASFWSEMEKKVEKWLSISIFYLVQMKIQLLFFSSQENFLKKKEAGYDIMGAHFNFS